MRFPLAMFFVAIAAATISACDNDSPEVALTNAYTIRFDLAETNEPLGALQFDVEYHGPGEIGWLGAGGGAACRWIVQATLHACNDKRGGALTCAIVDTGGFTGPIPLMQCELLSSDDALDAEDFSVTVTDASTPNLMPIDAAVSVSSIVATPASTTTTTNPDVPPTQYDVVFALGDEGFPFRFTLLQLELTHEGVIGGWLGDGHDVDCRWLVPADTRLCNEVSNRLVSCVATADAVIDATGPILECGFSSYEEVVDTSDFSAFVVDVSSPFGVSDYVYVPVTSVTPR